MTTAPTDHAAIRARLEARIAEGWGRYLAVPDHWLPHLDELDRQLAQIDPGYQLAQVKTKWHTLRYYLEQEWTPACCVTWLREHPVPDDDAPEVVTEAWVAQDAEHEASAGHRAAQAELEERNDRMADLAHAAEAASAHW